ncbi:hypothetical protein cypCar_00002297 [Cyprinus carpio]|nr:hypothetical protein cypCar_00002297 [Cyprinus carpio]
MRLSQKARALKDEGNEYFKEKNYKKAVVSYTEGLKNNCMDIELNAILYTNRAAAHFHLGNMRSALNDATAAKKLKPEHIKAIIRGLMLLPTDKKLQELRATADKQKRKADRDARKAKVNAKKEQNEKEALLAAIKEHGIKLLKTEPSQNRGSDREDDAADGVMFGEELPPWDLERKYQPQNLQLFLEDPDKGDLYRVDLEKSLLDILQHQKCSVKAGTPSFIVLVSGSPFSKQFLSGKKVQRLK